MKLLIASDIHGSAYWCSRLMDAYKEEKADRMILLGDILYHGPRNALPREYDPQSVSDLLNPLSDRILCVRGNCDALRKEDVVLSGHTHIPITEPTDGGLYFNPGSVSIPKNGSKNGYMTLENGLFIWKSFEEGEYARYQL